jgi:hypothetical protein
MGPLFNPVIWVFGCIFIGVLIGAIFSISPLIKTWQHSSKRGRIAMITLGMLMIWGGYTWLAGGISNPRTPPTTEDIVGVWFIGDRPSNHTTPSNSSTFAFHADGTFSVDNVPAQSLLMESSTHDERVAGSGTWDIDQSGEEWFVYTHAASTKPSGQGFTISFFVRERSGSLLLCIESDSATTCFAKDRSGS